MLSLDRFNLNEVILLLFILYKNSVVRLVLKFQTLLHETSFEVSLH